MTDALVSSVLKQLVSVVQQEVKLVACARKDVKALTSTLQMLQAVIRDAETKQITEESVKHWLEELRDVVYDADDVLDEWNTRILRSQMQEDDDANASLHEKTWVYLMLEFASIVVKLQHLDRKCNLLLLLN
ncbi:hypothetical protein FRX31_021527 [Thalictrum thalictroides]|uniref:Disease resistance N-terminal domain-containing protein n=1 Tax=Thalictrum thalictroides TaxID=46969 RepID=A0A7J6VVM9_THATH|nr:hypothetical protein FRX31_021527 [Thalictrum thalictroides]